MILNIRVFYIAVQDAHFSRNKNYDGSRGQNISDGAGVQQTLNTHKVAENKRGGKEIDKLTGESADHGLRGLADGLEEYARGDDEAGKEDHREENVEAFERKLVVQLAFLTEEVDN